LNGIGEQGQGVSIWFIKSDATPETPSYRLDQVRVGDEMTPKAKIHWSFTVDDAHNIFKEHYPTSLVS
jgi:hypothetical protein